MKNLQDRFLGGRTRVIAFTSDVCDTPIEVEVVRFKPRQGDITKRYWTKVQKNQLIYESQELAPYCLADIHKAAEEFEEYMDEHWERTFLSHTNMLSLDDDLEEPVVDQDGDVMMDDISQADTFPSHSLKSDESVVVQTDIIAKTHRIAFFHYCDLPVSPSLFISSELLTGRTGQSQRGG